MTRNALMGWALLGLAACEGGTEASFLASARALLDKHDTNGAIIQLKNALDKNPNSAPARILLGRTLLQGGDPAAALTQLRKAQSAGAPPAQVAPDIARALMVLGEDKKLVAELKQLGIKTTHDKKAAPVGGLPLAGKTVVVTGTLVNYDRVTIETAIKDAGGKASGSVSKRLAAPVSSSSTAALALASAWPS